MDRRPKQTFPPKKHSEQVCEKMLSITSYWASQVAPVIKKLFTNTGDLTDTGSIPGLGRSPGEGHDKPLHYSCLENPHGQRSLERHSS